MSAKAEKGLRVMSGGSKGLVRDERPEKKGSLAMSARLIRVSAQ